MTHIPTSTAKDVEYFDSRKDSDWLNPIAMSELQRAVKTKRKDVVLNGDRFIITYGFRRTYPSSHETVDSIRLNTADGSYVPMGYIPIKRIMEFDFEAGHE